MKELKTKQELISLLNQDERIIKIKSLEHFIDSSPELYKLLERKKEVSKQMVMCRHIGLDNAYLEYKKEYEEIDILIASYPNVDEYMELLDEVYNDLQIMVSYIEDKINKKLEE